MIEKYPLFLLPHYEAKPWGGTWLNRYYGKNYESGKGEELLGESWELSALPEGENIIRNGIFIGQPLSVIYHDYPELFGVNEPVFPLLIKLIDARLNLSIQIHEKNEATGESKNEAWIVLKAREGAQMILGAELETGKELRYAIETGNFVKNLKRVDVKAGDVFYVPVGTVHAIGRGIVVYEIQQPSNVTYRLHDYERSRELQIDKGCKIYNSNAEYGKIESRKIANGDSLILEKEFFSVEKVDANKEHFQTSSDRFLVYTALGKGEIIKDDKKYTYKNGETFLIPAGYGEFKVSGGVLIKAYVTSLFA